MKLQVVYYCKYRPEQYGITGSMKMGIRPGNTQRQVMGSILEALACQKERSYCSLNARDKNKYTIYHERKEPRCAFKFISFLVHVRVPNLLLTLPQTTNRCHDNE